MRSSSGRRHLSSLRDGGTGRKSIPPKRNPVPHRSEGRDVPPGSYPALPGEDVLSTGVLAMTAASDG